MNLQQRIEQCKKDAAEIKQSYGAIESVTFTIKDFPLSEIMQYAKENNEQVHSNDQGNGIGYKYLMIYSMPYFIYAYSKPLIVKEPVLIEELENS